MSIAIPPPTNEGAAAVEDDGAKAEHKRFAAIMDLPEAVNRQQSALVLALAGPPVLSVQQVQKILRTVPEDAKPAVSQTVPAPSQNPFETAMASDNPEVGACNVVGGPWRGPTARSSTGEWLTAMTTDVEDLLGPESPTQGVSGRPRSGHAVSITWLSKVFRMDKTTVKMRLAHCAPWSTVGNYPVYDIAQAAPYLPPSADVADQIMALDPASLPPHLSAEFWRAKLKRQKYEREAANLWRRSYVADVFREVFDRIDEGLRHTSFVRRNVGASGGGLVAQVTSPSGNVGRRPIRQETT